MASDIRRTQANNNQELQSLYEEYKKKKKQVQDENQEDLSSIKEKGQKEIQKERENSLATINHIKKENAKAKEALAQESEKKLTYEKTRNKDMVQKEREQAKLFSEKREEQTQTQSQQLRKEQQEFEKTKDEFRKAKGQEVLQTRDELSNRLEQERLQGQERYNDLRKRGTEAYKAEQQTQDQKISDLQYQNKTALEKEKSQGHKYVTKTKQEYSQELQQLHKEGDRNVAAQKEMNEASVKEVKDQHSEEVKELKARQEAERLNRHNIFMNEKARNDQIYKKDLQQQHDEFKANFEKNLVQQDKVLMASKTKLLEEITDQKLETMNSAGKYLKAKDDPFYQMQKLDGRLKETATDYILEAPVPEYEKDQVKVFVRNGRLVLQGQRRFEDKVENKDEGHKISTNSYQTFREEVKLDRPVAEKLIESTWSDGHLKVRIPKV